MKGKFTIRCIQNCRNAATCVLQYAITWCSSCRTWDIVSSLHEENSIPGDVPKGHFVVYVGEKYKRYVIQIALLKHPLFKTLLDSAEDTFEFANGPKLYLPCNEYVFVRTLQCIGSSTQSRELHHV